MMYFLCFLFFIVQQINTLDIPSPNEYFESLEKSIKINEEKAINDCYSKLDFLIKNHAIYNNDVFFLTLPCMGNNKVLDTIINNMTKSGWNIESKDLSVKCEIDYNDFLNNYIQRYHRIIKTDDIDDNPLNYRTVVNLDRECAWTQHSMFIWSVWGGYFNGYVCPERASFIKIDTRHNRPKINKMCGEKNCIYSVSQ